MKIRIVNKGFKDSNITNDNHYDITKNQFWNKDISEMSLDALMWLFKNNNTDFFEYSFHTIDDVKSNPNNIFYFLFNSSQLNFSLLDGGSFSNKFIDLFKQPNLKILFMDPHESILYNKLESLSNFISSNEIDKERFLYINNDYDIEKKSKNLNFYGKKWNHLFVNTSCGYIQDSCDIEFKKNKDFLFLTKNKMIREHRVILLSFLQKNNLLKFTNYSCLHQVNSTLVQNKIKKTFGENMFNTFYENIKSVMTLKFKTTKYEKGKYTSSKEEFINYAGVHDFRDYETAYINITTESGFGEDFLHISEKSLKPFAMYQLPIIVSCPFHIKAMKELYDLDFFDDFIDHSYDNEIDNKKRMIMIQKEILRLSKLENELPIFFEKNKERFLSNRNKIEKIGNWKETKLFNYILNF